MNIIITVILIVGISYLINVIAQKIKISSVVLLIIGGIIIGLPGIREHIIDSNIDIINTIGDFGLFALMFLAGLESSWQMMYKEKKESILIALSAMIVPFILGFFVFYLLDYSIIIALIVGIAMAVTAESTKARVLIELKKLNTRVGSAMMGAGIMDDMLSMSFFIVLLYFLDVAKGSSILLGGAIFAFLLGVIIQLKMKDTAKKIKHIEKSLLITLVPFFFISLGLTFDISSILKYPLVIFLILSIGFLGKMIGTYLVKSFTKFTWKQMTIIGWGMNSRGAVELAMALIAYKAKLLPIELFSGLVVMAIVTTLVFPIVVSKIIKNNKNIMNRYY